MLNSAHNEGESFPDLGAGEKGQVGYRGIVRNLDSRKDKGSGKSPVKLTRCEAEPP